MSIDPYVAAAIALTWSAIVITVVAFFIGRDRLIDDIRRQGDQS